MATLRQPPDRREGTAAGRTDKIHQLGDSPLYDYELLRQLELRLTATLSSRWIDE